MKYFTHHVFIIALTIQKLLGFNGYNWRNVQGFLATMAPGDDGRRWRVGVKARRVLFEF